MLVGDGALALGAVPRGKRARMLELPGAAQPGRGGGDRVDQREHALARRLRLAAVEVEERAAEAVAHGAPAVLLDAGGMVHGELLAGVVALREPAHERGGEREHAGGLLGRALAVGHAQLDRPVLVVGAELVPRLAGAGEDAAAARPAPVRGALLPGRPRGRDALARQQLRQL